MSPCPPRPLVLLAEDDDAMRRVLSDALVRDGYDVVSTVDGSGLVEAVTDADHRARRPFVIVSDHRMPGLTGLDALRTLRRAGSTIPFILITAFGDDETMGAALALDPSAVFSKPFDVDDLLGRILEFLAFRAE